MKKLFLLYCTSLCIFLSSCWRNDGDISIRYKDNKDSYSMNAWFGKSKTRKVERYMNEMIGKENDIQFHNTRMDAELTMDDGSKFYIKKSPGHVLIKMKKEETSDHSFYMLKAMCKGMKEVVLK